MHQEDGQDFGRKQWRKGIPSKWKSKCEKVRKCGIILEKKYAGRSVKIWGETNSR